MPIVRVERSDDSRLRGYASVGDPAALRERGSFIAEGRFVVERLLRDGGFDIESLLLNDAAQRALEPLLVSLGVSAPIYVCAPGLFLGLTGHDFHRGCLALVRRPAPRVAWELTAKSNTLVVLEGVANADNVGGVFRTAAAFGVDAILLSPTATDPLYRKAIRTSMAETLRVPFARLGEGRDAWPGCLSRLSSEGFTLIALTPREPSMEIDEFVALGRPSRFALLVGTEGDGLSSAAAALAPRHVRIAMRPEVDSLNLAVATGIALQRLTPR